MATKENSRDRRLRELSGSDYEIADGEPDIRGWDVKDASGRYIGEVDDLIFDAQAGKVRYMVVDLDDNELDLDDDREVLIPIGLAQLDDSDDDVILNGVTTDQLRSLPDYDDDDSITPEYESSIRSIFGSVGSAAITGTLATDSARTSDNTTARNSESNFYDHGHFNDENLYRNRRQAASSERTDEATDQTIPVIRENLEVGKEEVERGGLRLRSRIVETPVEERVNLREENVNVERTPVDRAASDADFRKEEVEVRERAEVPTVNKEARVVEEISLNKEVTERDETIRDTVRETKVDIDKLNEKNRRTSNDDDEAGRII